MRTFARKIKNVPLGIKEWYIKNFPGCTYKFYYYLSDGNKIYGCNVFKNGVFYHNATQANLAWYRINQ